MKIVPVVVIYLLRNVCQACSTTTRPPAGDPSQNAPVLVCVSMPGVSARMLIQERAVSRQGSTGTWQSVSAPAIMTATSHVPQVKYDHVYEDTADYQLCRIHL